MRILTSKQLRSECERYLFRLVKPGEEIKLRDVYLTNHFSSSSYIMRVNENEVLKSYKKGKPLILGDYHYPYLRPVCSKSYFQEVGPPELTPITDLFGLVFHMEPDDPYIFSGWMTEPLGGNIVQITSNDWYPGYGKRNGRETYFGAAIQSLHHLMMADLL